MSFTYNGNDILKDTVLIGNPTTTTQSTTDNSTRIATTAFVKKQSFGRPLASIGTGETITTTQNGYFLHINYLNGLYVNIFNANALDNPKANFMLFNNVTSQSIPYSIELRSGVGGIFLGLLGSGISSLTIAYREVVGIQSDGSNWIITSRTSRSDIFNGTNTYTKSNVFTTNTKDYSTIMNDYNSEQHYSFLPYIQTSSFNGITQDGDMGIIFQDNAQNTTKGFVISPWAANYSGIRITKDGTHIRGGLIMSPSTDSTSNVSNISFKNGGEVSTIGRLWSYYNGTTIDNKLYLDIYESLNIRNISNVADPIMNIATTGVEISKTLKVYENIQLGSATSNFYKYDGTLFVGEKGAKGDTGATGAKGATGTYSGLIIERIIDSDYYDIPESWSGNIIIIQAPFNGVFLPNKDSSTTSNIYQIYNQSNKNIQIRSYYAVYDNGGNWSVTNGGYSRNFYYGNIANGWIYTIQWMNFRRQWGVIHSKFL